MFGNEFERKRRIVIGQKSTVPKPTPAEPIDNQNTPCDVTNYCDVAKFEVIVIIDNLAKSLFFCGHHFRKYRIALFERAYEVKEIK